MTKEDLIKLLEKLPDGCEVSIRVDSYIGYHKTDTLEPMLLIHEGLQDALLTWETERYYLELNELENFQLSDFLMTYTFDNQADLLTAKAILKNNPNFLLWQELDKLGIKYST